MPAFNLISASLGRLKGLKMGEISLSNPDPAGHAEMYNLLLTSR
jgi:hypothetical protein